MNRIKPGDLVVIFQACLVKRYNTEDHTWVDRQNDPQLVVWVSNRCDPDTGSPDVGVLLNLKNTKGIYVFPRSALVTA